MKWVYKGKEITEVPKGYYGFVYELDYSYKDFIYHYYGQKSFYSYKTLPALKNGTQRPNSKRIGKNVKGKREYFDIVSKESNWLKYESSSKDIPKEAVLIGKRILMLCKTKRELTYMEAKCLFMEEAIEREDCFNKNILGRFFRDNLI